MANNDQEFVTRKEFEQFKKESQEDRALLRGLIKLVLKMRKDAQGQEAATIRRMETLLGDNNNNNAGSRPEGKEPQDGHNEDSR